MRNDIEPRAAQSVRHKQLGFEQWAVDTGLGKAGRRVIDDCGLDGQQTLPPVPAPPR